MQKIKQQINLIMVYAAKLSYSAAVLDKSFMQQLLNCILFCVISNIFVY